MKLELGYIQIEDIQFSKECKVENGTLYVDPEAVKAFMFEDDDVKAWVKDFSFDVAKPGESVRITPVKDVIEPRLKIEGPGVVFPGVMGKVQEVGQGLTYCMDGATVITVGKIVGFQEGVIDMAGPIAKYCPFSETQNVCVVIEPAEV